MNTIQMLEALPQLSGNTSCYIAEVRKLEERKGLPSLWPFTKWQKIISDVI